ncbi:ATP-binding cassette domain-containing protein [Donghicola mangrovi]|uniref:ATP-binding cassette domain-containing protein n=1 Tax=Donghicola mangrovi TaxID=2729614 RepID=A0A850PZB9_9RHOB|nr:ATP-binding cassette domain-containing protein [Donghicola mangrovi]NVO22176.1 ATP-binding cassette domain-containing protein [Donghicola mangrovi]
MLTLEGLDIVQDDFRLTADWSVPTGARVAIIGPSGGGKSTLLSAISGFAEAQGKVLWNGAPLGDLAPGKRPIAMLFQDQNLFPHLTAAQNVGLALSQGRLTKAQGQRVGLALSRVGLDGLENRKPSQLSGGQQSRVALARVLLQDRPLWLLDEPFAALGPGLRSEMLALVQQIAAEVGATILMVTHDPEDARRFADLVVVVDQGVALAPRDTEDLFANPDQALRDYLGH